MIIAEELVNIIVICAIIGGCIYFYLNTKKVGDKEGMKSKEESSGNARDDASKYLEELITHNRRLKDGHNIPSYRSDYENVVLQLDDYIGHAMLQTALNVDIKSDDPSVAIAALEKMNKLEQSKKTLNSLMDWMDGQK
jgi:septation ring formation regulator EzrA